jgi:hypothetical protein
VRADQVGAAAVQVLAVDPAVLPDQLDNLLAAVELLDAGYRDLELEEGLQAVLLDALLSANTNRTSAHCWDVKRQTLEPIVVRFVDPARCQDG